MANWADLGPRMISAAAMSVVGAVAIVLGNPFFLALVLVAVGAMVWEVMTICQHEPAKTEIVLPVVFSAVLFICVYPQGPIGFSIFSVIASALLAFACSNGLKKERVIGGVLLFAIFWVGFGLAEFRTGWGFPFILWLFLVVIASDVMGYFAGRTFGGPKFWPSISPKKTWSGTVAGWGGAALVGVGFVIWHGSPALLIPISVLTAFAGQLGDIAESALKRRTGVKDSSNLIPGHGGVLDRFDAVSGAVLFLLVVSLFIPVTV